MALIGAAWGNMKSNDSRNSVIIHQQSTTTREAGTMKIFTGIVHTDSDTGATKYGT